MSQKSSWPVSLPPFRSTTTAMRKFERSLPSKDMQRAMERLERASKKIADPERRAEAEKAVLFLRKKLAMLTGTPIK